MEINNDLQLLTGSMTDLRWFKENSKHLSDEFEGNFVAIKDENIVSFAPTIDILLEKLGRNNVDEGLVLIKHITPKGEIVIF